MPGMSLGLIASKRVGRESAPRSALAEVCP